MNDVDGEEENEQSTSSIDVPQDFSMHHSDCMQSSETHQSSDEPMNSPICTVLISAKSNLCHPSKAFNSLSNSHNKFGKTQHWTSQQVPKSNPGRKCSMKKAIHCLDSLQSTARNASVIPEKEKDGLDKFDEYIVPELRNV